MLGEDSRSFWSGAVTITVTTARRTASTLCRAFVPTGQSYRQLLWRYDSLTTCPTTCACSSPSSAELVPLSGSSWEGHESDPSQLVFDLV